MKRLLNTLYVTTEGAALRKDGENVVVEVDGAERGRAPLHLLGSVVVFGATFASPALLGACAAAGIALVFLDRSGRNGCSRIGRVLARVALCAGAGIETRIRRSGPSGARAVSRQLNS